MITEKLTWAPYERSVDFGLSNRSRCLDNVRTSLSVYRWSKCLTYFWFCRFVGLGEDPQVLAQRAPALFGVRGIP